MKKALKLILLLVVVGFCSNVFAEDESNISACKDRSSKKHYVNSVYDFEVKPFYEGAVIVFKYRSGSCSNGDFFPYKNQEITLREIRLLGNLSTGPEIKINQSRDNGFTNVLAIVPAELFNTNKMVQVRLRFGDRVDTSKINFNAYPLSIYDVNIEQEVDAENNMTYKFSQDSAPIAQPKCLILTQGSWSVRGLKGLGFNRSCGSSYGLIDSKKGSFIKNSCRSTLEEIFELLKTESKCAGTDIDYPNIFFTNHSSF